MNRRGNVLLGGATAAVAALLLLATLPVTSGWLPREGVWGVLVAAALLGLSLLLARLGGRLRRSVPDEAKTVRFADDPVTFVGVFCFIGGLALCSVTADLVLNGINVGIVALVVAGVGVLLIAFRMTRKR